LPSFLRIKHNFGIVTRVNANCKDPVGVLEISALQKYLLLGEGVGDAFDLDFANEGVQVVVRQLALHLTYALEQVVRAVIFILEYSLQVLGLIPFLQVLLPVQTSCRNEAFTLLFAAC